MSEYINFTQIPYSGKTKRFEVTAVKTQITLGRICWYSGWRQYVFMPSFETLWNSECLKSITEYLEQLNKNMEDK